MKTIGIHTLQILLLLFCSLSWAAAQDGSVKGVVSDKEDPLAFVKVALRVANTETTLSNVVESDFDGNYEITGVPAGEYFIIFDSPDYGISEYDVRIEAGKETVFDVILVKDQMFKTVVITSDRSETKIERSATSIESVGASLADNTAANRADDVLVKVPGVSIIDGQANIRGGAGFSYGAGSRVLILVDDMPFLAADAGLVNWRDIPIENMAQMEVLKGAGSALYGSSALNGVINIRTAKATSTPVSKVAIYGSAYGTPQQANTAWWNYDSIPYNDQDTMVAPQRFAGRLGYRKPMELGVQFSHRRQLLNNRLSLAIGGQYFAQDAYLMGQYERKFRMNINSGYRVNDRMTVGINANYNTGSSGSFFLWANEFFLADIDSLGLVPLSNTVTESKTLRINVDPYATIIDKYKNRHRIQTRMYYVSNANDQNQSNQSTLYYGEYQFNRSFGEELGHLGLVAGAVGQYATIDAQLYGNAQYSFANAAGYLQLSKGFFLKENTIKDYKLMLSFGSRVEMNNVRGPDIVLISGNLRLPESERFMANPYANSTEARPVFRAGANYELTEYSFLRASWGQGYRYPTIAERYIATSLGDENVTGLGIRANPNLEAETGWSAEIGYRQLFRLGKEENPDAWKGFADVSVFWTEYQNMMEFTFGGGNTQATGRYFSSINTGDTRVAGAELSLGAQGSLFGIPTNVIGGYTFIDPVFKDFNELQRILSSSQDNVLKFRNNHTAKLDIESFFLKREALSVGVAFLYASAMQAVDRFFEDVNVQGYYINNEGNAVRDNVSNDVFGIGRYRRDVNDGRYFDLQARVAYTHRIRKNERTLLKLKFSLVGRNLLNQEYTFRPALIAPPRNVTFRLDVDF